MAYQSGPHIRKRPKEKSITFACFTIPGLILYSVFFILPIGMGIYYSMTNWNGISPHFDFIGLKNYAKLFADKRFFKSLTFNLQYSILLIIGIVGLSLILALLLNSKIKGITTFRAFYFLPAVLSAMTVGLIFNQIFYRMLPVIGKSLHIEVLSTNILANPNLAIYGILFVNIWQGSAIPTVLFLAGLQTIPIDLYEAAALDGANSWHRFKKITVPFLVPVLSVVLVMVLKSGIMVFDYIKSLTEGGPAGKTESIAMLIYNQGFVENRYSYSIAEAIITGLIICAISVAQIAISNKKKV
ncbi:sugar ABC transporter permease [Clostridium sp. chh4-2]|uniref:carbohydrate ABC transporter permease n=1 Tax=Clostridium sp. chh4-2 TaxID=2067550 RepID=UPI000CCE8541|nr:sugar ABC transporter permease [Clostridium sp. chh4-2]PNV61946.1 sugar ABC transporter permease [Clostridium sp. chh4-2]